MLIRFGFEAVSTAAIKKIELIEVEGARTVAYQVTYLNEEVETFVSTSDLDEQFATPVTAPPGFFVVDRDTAQREQVLAFLIDPLSARSAAPVPVTVSGSCVLDGRRGLLAPDGRVSTLAETFADLEDFTRSAPSGEPLAHVDGEHHPGAVHRLDGSTSRDGTIRS
jgi:hypothetical protein